MYRLTLLSLPAASLLCLALAGAPARAETTAGGTPAPATASVPQNKLVASYGEFAGSPDNAASLVQGLRTGTAITLMSPALPGSPPPEPVVFVPPTRPMGYGNIRIALALAQHQLSVQGITQPSPQQLQGALMGSEGVLQMRASGMGWGQIANSMGVKLGSVMSGNSAAAVPAQAGSGGHGGHAVSARGNGVVSTGHGAAARGEAGHTTGHGSEARSASGVTTGHGSAGHASAGRGGGAVTTAGGSGGRGASGITTAAGGGGNGGGNAYAYGRSGGGGGAITAAGASAGAHGGGASRGHGHGHGKP
ncbi:MAG: hypothetical protein JNJ60_01430 [Rhodocyclaceae bacterium]|nr:hypothetical protein [Rhodocyclaceae bacterium]